MLQKTNLAAALVRWTRVSYRHPHFYEEHRIGMGPAMAPAKMTRNQLGLAARIKSEIAGATAQTDVLGLRAFLELINLSLPKNTGAWVFPRHRAIGRTRRDRTSARS